MDINNGHQFSLRDQNDRLTYAANLMPISKRSKFKLFQNIHNPSRALAPETFIATGGSSSQNQYRYKKFNNSYLKSYYGSSEPMETAIILPCSEKPGKNNFWPVKN